MLKPLAITKLFARYFVDTQDYKQTVLLAGTGRSGTTWLGDLINHANAYRSMFEPFHARRVDLVQHFNYRQYLRPDNTATSFLGPATRILSGAVRDPWIDRFNRKFIASKRLIKDIRANLLLKWIKANFPEIPIVLLLRHPCAVAHSKLKLGWGAHLEEYLSQQALMEDFLEPFEKPLRRARDPFERQIFMWSVENYVPLKQLGPREYHLVLYERLYDDPEPTLRALCDFLGQPFDSCLLEVRKEPSTTARKGQAIRRGKNLLESWRGEITAEQRRRAKDILALFGLDELYAEDPMPQGVSAEDLPFALSN